MTDTYQLDSKTLATVTQLSSQGQYVEAYQTIANVVPLTYLGGQWFSAAADVNGDTNYISTFIRNYVNYAEFPSQALP